MTVTKLTSAQEALLPVWADKFIKYGLQTRSQVPEYTEAEYLEMFAKVYKEAGLPAPTKVYIADSPAKLINLVVKKAKIEISKDQVQCGYGTQDAEWLAYADFLMEVCGVELTKPSPKPLIDLCKKGVGWYSAWNDTVLVSRLPVSLEFRNNNLHCTTGPAVSYNCPDSDVYHMFGVTIPKQLSHFVTTPVDEIDPKDVLGIENTEVRSAVMAKLGSRMLSHMKSKLIDKQEIKQRIVKPEYMKLGLAGAEKLMAEITAGKVTPDLDFLYTEALLPYELREIEINGVKGRFLTMQHPSVDKQYMEFVDMACNTVVEAWSWSNNGVLGTKLPDILS